MENNMYGFFDPKGKFIQLKPDITEEEILKAFDDNTIDSAYYFNNMYVEYSKLSIVKLKMALEENKIPEEDRARAQEIVKNSEIVIPAVKRTTSIIESKIPKEHRDKIIIDATAAAVLEFMSNNKEAKERTNKESSN